MHIRASTDLPQALPDPFAPVASTLQALQSDGRSTRILRIWTPWPIMAFSRRDERSPHFATAAQAATEQGFAPAVRPVGGTFAPLHAGSLVVDEFGWDAHPSGPAVRFDRHAGVLADVFGSLGIDARIGEVAGEYCPGAHSINRGGVVKISGTAQRVSRGAWLVSSVVQVTDAAPLREVTHSVATALGAPVDTATIGTLDETVPGLRPQDVASRIAARFIADGVVRVEF